MNPRLALLSAIAILGTYTVTEHTLPRLLADEKPIRSEVQKTDAGERILVQEITIEAPVEAVWAAYTTKKGLETWMANQVEIDLRVGGTLRSRYDTTGKIGDPGTNTLHIINYVPNTLITLRAELESNWPEVLKQDADKLSNVVLFDRLSDKRTRVRSYGIGYSDKPEIEKLLEFFIPANESLFAKMKRVVEKGS
ncbi:MAG: SRPBCC domain-containing protein [Planctomycetes bacterium]|nr:SRPBCC domain-containing protein [Planctomycetota bacterium]